jgi:hypothetical protein
MSDTTQGYMLPVWTTILDSLHIFARLPEWLERAADPKQVADALRASIPEFITGRLSLQECRVSHLRISHDGTEWSGTYYCTIADPTAAQSRTIAHTGQYRFTTRADA